jgi:hypothetical protein
MTLSGLHSKRKNIYFDAYLLTNKIFKDWKIEKVMFLLPVLNAWIRAKPNIQVVSCKVAYQGDTSINGSPTQRIEGHRDPDN